jgi:adenosylcobinamide amidohydrolase
MRSMNAAFSAHADQDALIVSFPTPVRILSWAVLNGGYCHANHVLNHHISGSDRWFCTNPERWLELATVRLGLQGKWSPWRQL